MITAYMHTASHAKKSTTNTIDLKINVKVSLSTGKSTVHLSNKSENSDIHPYDFYIGMWMGGSSPHMDYQMLKGQEDGSGMASLCLPILSTDSDHLKFGVYIKDPDTKIMRHIASGFKSILDVASSIENVTHPDLASSSIFIKDNYSKNQALLHLSNNGTDLKTFVAFCAENLRPSVLHDNESINQKVIEMSFGLHNWIQSCSSVTNTNGGPNFVNSMCFTQCNGCAINYPLLNLVYSSEKHRAPLSLLAYQALATLNYVNLSAKALMDMPDHEFVRSYVVPLCKNFTVCPQTMNYSGDKTLDPAGNLDMGTEDFAMVFSQHMFADVRKGYEEPEFVGRLGQMTDEELQSTVAKIKASPKSEDCAAHLLISDDCETLSGMIKSFEGSILDHYKLAASGAAKSRGVSERLAEMIWDSTRGLKNLSKVSMEDWKDVAALLARYGELRSNCEKGLAPQSQIAISIVSAKGPSFAMGQNDLNGHACTISQTLGANGEEHYTIGEGTANMTIRSLPESVPEQVSLMLNTGEKKFKMLEALSCMSQNYSDILKTDEGKLRVEQAIPGDFKGKDPYKACPFYMAGFFVGLEMDACTPGIIPLQAGTVMPEKLSACDPVEDLWDKVMEKVDKLLVEKHERSAGCKPGAPVFGAPIVDMSGENVTPLPINLGKVMGEQEAREFLSQVAVRNHEVNPPRASEETLKTLMSRWIDLEPASKISKSVPTENVVLSSAEGFQCANMARAALEYKKRVARKFNELQSKESAGEGDGVSMSVMGQMMSVVTQFSVPLPKTDTWRLSSVRNLRRAVSMVPFRMGSGQVSGQFTIM